MHAAPAMPTFLRCESWHTSRPTIPTWPVRKRLCESKKEIEAEGGRGRERGEGGWALRTVKAYESVMWLEGSGERRKRYSAISPQLAPFLQLYAFPTPHCASFLGALSFFLFISSQYLSNHCSKNLISISFDTPSGNVFFSTARNKQLANAWSAIYINILAPRWFFPLLLPPCAPSSLLQLVSSSNHFMLPFWF